jgi:hypothetical protein
MLENKLSSSLSPLQRGAKIPINSSRFTSNFIRNVLRTHRTLAILQARLSTAFRSNLSQGEAQGDHKEAIHPILGAGGAPKEPLDIVEDHEEEAAAAADTI